MATLLFVCVQAQRADLHFCSGCLYLIKEKQQNKKEQKQSSQKRKQHVSVTHLFTVSDKMVGAADDQAVLEIGM